MAFNDIVITVAFIVAFGILALVVDWVQQRKRGRRHAHDGIDASNVAGDHCKRPS